MKIKTDGAEESSYYGYNAHTDVETLTSETGDTRATYGYTAYGSNDDKLFTGVDKPDPVDPAAKEEYNPYRFNAKRWDNSTGMYDMGFRDYNPGLNRFLTLDSYNGALADLSLGTDPWTSNRYAFTGGNPITGIELDGHMPDQSGIPCGNPGGAACNPSTSNAKPSLSKNINLPNDVLVNNFREHLGGDPKNARTLFTPYAVTPDYDKAEERGGRRALWNLIWSLTVDDYVECSRNNESACQSLGENALLNAAFAGGGKDAKKLGNAVEESAEAAVRLATINWSWKSRKTFGHTFEDHGKSVTQLADRARKKGGPQGRWPDKDAAADFLRSVWVEGAGVREVDIPAGLGEIVFEDGTTLIVTRARLVPSANGLYRSAFPIPE